MRSFGTNLGVERESGRENEKKKEFIEKNI